MILHRLVASSALVIHMIIGVSHVASGQNKSDSVIVMQPKPQWTTGSINVQFGNTALGLDELNGSLTANGRPAFSTNVATIGIAGYARFQRLIIGGDYAMAIPQRETAPGWVSKMSTGSAMIDAGYVILDRARLMVYPQLSLGIRATSLKVQRAGDFSYEDGVRDPARGVEMSSLGALAGMGFVAETHLSTAKTGAFSIGVRAGMVKPLGAPGTLAGESVVRGAPHEASGWNVRLTIGKPIGRRRDVATALSTAVLALPTW